MSESIFDRLDRIFFKMTPESIRQAIDKQASCRNCLAVQCPDPECLGQCQGMGNCLDCRSFRKHGLEVDSDGYVPPG